jgi:hypothetical protein
VLATGTIGRGLGGDGAEWARPSPGVRQVWPGGVSVRTHPKGVRGLGAPEVPSGDMRGVAHAGAREPEPRLGRGAPCTKPRPGRCSAAGTPAVCPRPARGRPRSRSGLASKGRRGVVTSGPAHRGEVAGVRAVWTVTNPCSRDEGRVRCERSWGPGAGDQCPWSSKMVIRGLQLFGSST